MAKIGHPRLAAGSRRRPLPLRRNFVARQRTPHFLVLGRPARFSPVRPHSRLQCRLLSLHGQQRRGDCSGLAGGGQMRAICFLSSGIWASTQVASTPRSSWLRPIGRLMLALTVLCALCANFSTVPLTPCAPGWRSTTPPSAQNLTSSQPRGLRLVPARGASSSCWASAHQQPLCTKGEQSPRTARTRR
jgi:hypothetical protein